MKCIYWGSGCIYIPTLKKYSFSEILKKSKNPEFYLKNPEFLKKPIFSKKNVFIRLTADSPVITRVLKGWEYFFRNLKTKNLEILKKS
jgi:hypothetical protein